MEAVNPSPREEQHHNDGSDDEEELDDDARQRCRLLPSVSVSLEGDAVGEDDDAVANGAAGREDTAAARPRSFQPITAAVLVCALLGIVVVAFTLSVLLIAALSIALPSDPSAGQAESAEAPPLLLTIRAWWTSSAACRLLLSSLSWLSRLSSPTPTAHSPAQPSALSRPVNLVRLARFFDRLDRGLPVVVGAVGGSNIEGHRLDRSRTLLPLLLAWLNQRYPVTVTNLSALYADNDALRSACPGSAAVQPSGTAGDWTPQHVSINRAAGATQSGLTSFCYRRLIPCDDGPAQYYHDPDLLLIDFAVNDVALDAEPISGSSPTVDIERLLRQVLLHSANTAVVLVYFAAFLTEGLLSGERFHHPVARHYHVPEVSFRDWARDWLYEPLHGLHPLPELQSTRRLPFSIPLPLAQLLRTVAGESINLDRELWLNGYHVNTVGQAILTQLTTGLLLKLHASLLASSYRSFADPLAFPDGSSSQLPSLLDARNTGFVAAPLWPPLAIADAEVYRCLVLQPPFVARPDQLQQQQAERLLHIDRNDGWLYAHSQHRSRFSMTIPAAAAASLSQYLRVALPSAVHSFMVAFLRSWNASLMGEATAWLSCGATDVAPDVPRPPWADDVTPPVVLNGTWQHASTQGDVVQVWPLSNSTATHVHAGRAESAYHEPRCELKFCHVRHSRVGEFRLIGLLWN